MRNTLETNTPEQLSEALLSYNSHICDIPDSFTVLDEYLYGLECGTFCAAFKHLSALVSAVYGDIIGDPGRIGLLKADKSGEMKVTSAQHISCVKKLLYAIGRFGELEGDVLCADSGKFADAYMTYYTNTSTELSAEIKEHTEEKRGSFFKAKNVGRVFELLGEHGLKFEHSGEGDTVRLTSLNDGAIPRVIKAFAQPDICRECFGFDYTKFNYRVFAHPSLSRLPLEDQYSFTLLSEEHREFLYELDRAMNDIGVTYGSCAGGWYSGTLPCQYNYKNKVRILQNIESGLIPHVVMRFGKKAAKMAGFIESLPEEYRSLIVRCKGCRKGECDHRIPVKTAENNYVLCNVAWWYFPPEKAAVPYIVRAFKIV